MKILNTLTYSFFRFPFGPSVQRVTQALLFFFFLVFSLPLQAQGRMEKSDSKTDANIQGHILDAATGEHLPFVSLLLVGTQLGVTSDETGHYFLSNLPPGDHMLRVHCMGYKPLEVPVHLSKGHTLELNLKIEVFSMSIDEIVVSSSRSESSKRTTPLPMNVLTTKTLERSGSNNLAEVLNYQTGLRIEYSCQNCGVPQLRINGLEGQYTQMLLDSRPLFSSLAGVYGLEQIPAEMVERVEVIRGGGSSLYGSGAIGGTLNIITKDPIRNQFIAQNRTSFLGPGSTDVNTSIHGSFVSNDHQAGGSIFGTIRSRTAYDRDRDGFSELPSIFSGSAGFRGYHKLGDQAKLSVEYHYIQEKRRGGDSLDLPPHESHIAELTEHRIHGGGLKYEWFSTNLLNRFQAFASGQSIHRESYFGTNKNPNAYGHTTDATVIVGAHYIHSFKRAWFMPADLTAGIEYSGNFLHDQMLGYHRDLKQDGHLAGVFVQNEWKDLRTNILVGLRLDKHNLIDRPILSPSIRLRRQVLPWLNISGGYGGGYRAPQAYQEDLHVAAVGGEISLISLAPGLKPEKAHSVNLSTDFDFNLGKVHTTLLLEGFYTNLKNVFTLVENGHDEQGNLLLERRNAAGAFVGGVHAQLGFEFSHDIRLELGYTFQKSRYKEGFQWSQDPLLIPQKRMFRSPDHYGYVSFSYQFLKNFNVNVNGNLTGPELVQHFAGFSTRDQEVVTRPFFDLGAQFGYSLNVSKVLRIDLHIGIKNIFDHYQPDIDRGMHRDAGYVYGPALPRHLYFGVKFVI